MNLLTGIRPKVVKKLEKVNLEMKTITGNCPNVVKESRKSRPGDEHVNGKLSKRCKKNNQKSTGR